MNWVRIVKKQLIFFMKNVSSLKYDLRISISWKWQKSNKLMYSVTHYPNCMDVQVSFKCFYLKPGPWEIAWYMESNVCHILFYGVQKEFHFVLFDVWAELPQVLGSCGNFFPFFQCLESPWICWPTNRLFGCYFFTLFILKHWCFAISICM